MLRPNNFYFELYISGARDLLFGSARGGSLLAMLGGPSGVRRIKPGLAIYKASTLLAILLLWPYFELLISSAKPLQVPQVADTEGDRHR